MFTLNDGMFQVFQQRVSEVEIAWVQLSLTSLFGAFLPECGASSAAERRRDVS